MRRDCVKDSSRKVMAMKVLCNGWRRIVHFHELIDRDISQVKATSPKNNGYRSNEIYVEIEGNEVSILSRADSLRLNGDFLFQIRMTRSEIANLAMIAYGRKRLGGFIDALARMRAPKKRKRKQGAQ